MEAGLVVIKLPDDLLPTDSFCFYLPLIGFDKISHLDGNFEKGTF